MDSYLWKEMREPRLLKEFQKFKDHEDITSRFRKTFYYGRLPKTPRSSLPLTEAAVEFFAKAVPKSGLDIVDIHYAASISRRACISPCSMMLAMVYIEQLKHKNPEYLQSVSSCDLFLVSMMVASKYLYDDGEDDEVFNDDWAVSAKMELKDLNRLERQFLAAIDWKLFVKPCNFYEVLRRVEVRIAQNESQKRNCGTTYADANCLSDDAVLSLCWGILLEDVVKVVVVSAVAYVSALATLVTAASLAPHCATFLSNTAHMVTPQSPLTPLSTNYTIPDISNTPMDRNWHWDLHDSLETSASSLPANCMRFRARHANHHQNGCRATVNQQLLKIELADPSNASGFVSEPSPAAIVSGVEEPRTVAKSFYPVLGLGGSKTFSVWNSLQYWPTCCGLNSYLL